ncbi:helix-hairpin-helix domain-containing protein [Agrobacterium sp. LMR679]|uniref:helix-hairpin-helix domain-containing protein n=1 Tax=Agrobacterium sp. LMR679 TaxID=3014335 RepID=UPI003FA441AC
MATFKNVGTISKFREKLVTGMVERGYEQEFAERIFKQLEGFGSYGFPESHAASFALIAYASSWLKCHHPDIFCTALLNSQPMGFYAPAQIVRDARDHGVEVRPVCVNNSRFDCTLEPTGKKNGKGEDRFAVRLGLRMVKGLSNDHAAKIVASRQDRPLPPSTICGEGRAFLPPPLSVWRRRMPFCRRFRLPDEKRSGPSRLCGMSRCRFLPPPPAGKMLSWTNFRNLPSRSGP